MPGSLPIGCTLPTSGAAAAGVTAAAAINADLVAEGTLGAVTARRDHGPADGMERATVPVSPGAGR